MRVRVRTVLGGVASFVAACLALAVYLSARSGKPSVRDVPDDADEMKLFGIPDWGYLPSLWLNYHIPTNQPKQTWFTQLRVAASTKATFFCVQRTGYGYLGIQQTKTVFGHLSEILSTSFFGDMEHRYYGKVIFSVWDKGDANCHIEAIGADAHGHSFGFEGTGCKIDMGVKWGNRDYAFVTTKQDLADGRVRLTAYWQDPAETQDWNLLGSISISKNWRGFGDGGISSFLEQYQNSFYEDELRMADFGPHLVETESGEWVSIRSADFRSTGNQGSFDDVAAVSPDGQGFRMGIAGDDTHGFRGKTRSGLYLHLPGSFSPSMVPSLQHWINLRSWGQLPRGSYTTLQGVAQYLPAMIGADSLVPANGQEALVSLLMVSALGGLGFIGCLLCGRPGVAGQEYDLLFSSCTVNDMSTISMAPLNTNGFWRPRPYPMAGVLRRQLAEVGVPPVPPLAAVKDSTVAAL